MSSHPAHRPRLPAAIWTLGFVSLLMDVSSEMIHSLLPVYLVVGLGASAFAVGLIEGFAEATALIVKVFSGMLSDYWGRRKPLAVLGYGLGALSKPLFALAPGAGFVFAARLIDRIGKGIRGAPRDALVAEIAPESIRGAAFGLRQSLDTVGAFLGPLVAMGLMLLWANDFRAVFWVAVIPGVLAVALLFLGVREPERAREPPERVREPPERVRDSSDSTRERGSVREPSPRNPIRRANLARLPRAYWWVVAFGAVFTLARFSEAFLVLRAEQGGLPLALVPMVLIAMNVVYSLSAYPFGKLSDSMDRRALLVPGLLVLAAADLALAWSSHWGWVWLGVSLWGLHLGITQGLLATMVADAAPPDLLGTAYGFFNLVSGIAMLAASALAGLLWDRFGAEQTFLAGAVFCLAALALLVAHPAAAARRRR